MCHIQFFLCHLLSLDLLSIRIPFEIISLLLLKYMDIFLLIWLRHWLSYLHCLHVAVVEVEVNNSLFYL
jgi:hypothetical protein